MPSSHKQRKDIVAGRNQRAMLEQNELALFIPNELQEIIEHSVQKVSWSTDSDQ